MIENEKPAKLVSRVFIRRGDTVAKGVSTRVLIPKIKENKLVGTDEISSDGEKWVRLDRHRQLSSYFDSPPYSVVVPPLSSEDFTDDLSVTVPPSAPPRDVEGKLQELAGMLKEIND
ncbi:MAG: hypothetical protein V3U37_04550 [Nitrospinaceae bacterium]